MFKMKVDHRGAFSKAAVPSETVPGRPAYWKAWANSPDSRGRQVSRFSFCWCALWLLLVSTSALEAQDTDRIWGRVFTDDGERYEGFLHWPSRPYGANWADIFETVKEIPDEHYRDWLDATQDGQPPARTIEFRGYRVSWEERHSDFAATTSTGIRFGQLAALVAHDDGQIEVIPRSGGRGAALTDVGPRSGTDPVGVQVTLSPAGMRASSSWEARSAWPTMRLTVEDTDRGNVALRGRNVQRIEFGTAPTGAHPASPRLYGTIEDRAGRSFTGFVSWQFSLFRPQGLNGYDSEDGDRHVSFEHIKTVRKSRDGATVTLTSGEEVEVFESRVWRRRRIRVSDPGLGRVELQWDAFRSLRLQETPGGAGYDAFDGGRPLFGTVVTQQGEEIEGRIRWDADEEWTWELLSGSSDDVDFAIEFGNIQRIERGEVLGSLVTLLDGRTFELTGSNDVGWDNKGIFVFPADSEEAGEAERSGGREWRYVDWEDFREVRFGTGPTEAPGS